MSPSTRDGVDVDYLFLQVWSDRAEVSDNQNCGNLLASDFGLTGYEDPSEIEANAQVCARVEAIRLAAGLLMNLGDVTNKTVPKMSLLATACLVPGSVASDIAGPRWLVSFRCSPEYSKLPPHRMPCRPRFASRMIQMTPFQRCHFGGLAKYTSHLARHHQPQRSTSSTRRATSRFRWTLQSMLTM